MDNKLREIDLYGTSYPLSLSMRGVQDIAKEYGSMEKAFDGLGNDNTTEEGLDKLVFIIKVMVEQGIKLWKFLGKKDLPKPLTLEEVGLLIDMNNMQDIMTTVFNVQTEDLNRNVLTKGAKTPNENATQTE